jgi:hypothetical protein
VISELLGLEEQLELANLQLLGAVHNLVDVGTLSWVWFRFHGHLIIFESVMIPAETSACCADNEYHYVVSLQTAIHY